jgi:arylsulfatase A-like enzyme
VGRPRQDSTGPRCSGHVNCSQDIVQQPYNPFALNSRYAERAAEIFARFKPGAGADAGKPFLLYVAFAHTHTPAAYDAAFENASTRPGYHQVFGNMLAELDSAVGTIVASLEANALAEDTLILLAADNGPADLAHDDCDDIGSAGPFLGGWQKSAGGGGGGGTGHGP